MKLNSTFEFHPISGSADANGQPWSVVSSKIMDIRNNFVYLSTVVPYNYPLDFVIIKDSNIHGWASHSVKMAIVRDRDSRGNEFEKNVAHEIGHLLGLKDLDSDGNLMKQSINLGTHLSYDQWAVFH